MTTRLLFNFGYDPQLGFLAESIDTQLRHERLFLDYRPACYVLVETAATSSGRDANLFLNPRANKLVALINDLLQQHTTADDGGGGAAYTCYITDIVLRGERANFIQCLVNDLGLDITPDFVGQLLVIEFTSSAAHRLVYATLRDNELPWYRLLPDICELNVALQIYKCACGTAMAAKGVPARTECLGFKVTDRIDLLERFIPIGFYHTFNCTGVYSKINLLTRNPPALERVLPILSVDIETIAQSPHVVPMGTTHDEKISSINLYLLYGQIHLHVCLYLNPLPASTAGRELAAKFESKMNSKYNNARAEERRGQRCAAYALFRGYESESAMLEAFCKYYCRGDIFPMVCLPRRYPHILTGHNLIAYDLRVIWRRAIFLQIDRLLESVHRIKYENGELHHPEFNDLAIVLDLMVLAKRNMLSDKLSLAAIAANRLRSENVTKMDLDSSLIRRIYMYSEGVHSEAALADFAKVYRVSSTPPTHSADGNFDFTKARVDPSRLKRSLYSDSRLRQVPERMPRLEQVLIYNIQDTITVTRVLIESNVLSLVTNMTCLFALNAEESGMCGNSRRLASCLVYNGLKYGTFVGAIPRHGNSATDTYHPYNGDDDGGGGGAYAGRQTARIPLLKTDNKKSYQGALNYAAVGFFTAVESFDFKSYYPNLFCYLNTDSTNCTIITLEFVKSLPPAAAALIERCTRNDLIRLFATQDPCVPTEDLLTPGYRGREIGHCLSWRDLCALQSREPVLAMFAMDSRERFIGRVLAGLLTSRRRLQEALRHTTSAVERRLLDSQQLGTKIILNSVYGVTGCPSFLYSHIPASAAITLFGRKFLTVCARLICTFYALARADSLAPDARAWYEAELRYLTTWAINCSSGRADELSVIADGAAATTKVALPVAERRRRWPYADLVCYVDTDGLKFHNPDNVDAEVILGRVNDAIACTKHLTLAIENRHDHVMILTKKKYAYSDSNGGKVGHVGYERHANPIIKKMLTGLVRVCCGRVATNPLHLLFDIFGCLHATNPCLLFERVKLNYHDNESSLQRYIDSVTKDYRGDIKTVMLLDERDVTLDLYEPQVVWSAHLGRLNLAKFIRKFHKIIERLLMSARCRHALLGETALMENPLLLMAVYHVWLDEPRMQMSKKYDQLVEFVRPHLPAYRRRAAAAQRLALEDAVDCHGAVLQKRSTRHVYVIENLLDAQQ